MIAVSEIVDRLNSALDAEGFEHYQFDRDFKPAINYAQDFVTQLYSRVMGERKFSEENLRDLLYIRIWLASDYSRVSFDPLDIGGEVWTIMGVYPKPEVQGIGVIPAGWTYENSLSMGTRYLSSNYSAFKTTHERINVNRGNPLENGNNVIVGDLVTYKYITFTNYKGSVSEIEIVPSIKRENVAIAYLLQPTGVTSVSDNIHFPVSVTALIVSKALDWISWKQGDQTNLKGVTTADVQQFIQLTL